MIAGLQASRSRSGEAYEDIEVARQWLYEREDCTGRIAVSGSAWAAASRCCPRHAKDLQDAAVNYGEVPRTLPSDSSAPAPIVANWRTNDGKEYSHPGVIDARLR